MNNQEIIDRVRKHFITDGGPFSTSAAGYCKYRGPNGAKCAAGLFIKDEDYEKDMEALKCGDEYVRSRLSFTPGPRQVDMLGRLQKAHDGCSMEKNYELFSKMIDSIEREYCS